MAPVWWFAVANCGVSFVVSLGFHAALSLVTGRWWVHALVAPMFLVLSLGIVHHALSAATNPAVQAAYRLARFRRTEGLTTYVVHGRYDWLSNQASEMASQTFASIRGLSYPKPSFWSVDRERATRPVRLRTERLLAG